MKEFFMKDVLEEKLIITLLALQPRKEKVTANYVANSPSMANSCTHGACKQTCTGAPPKKRPKR
jgi:flagellar assembly factor FliW